MNVNGLHQDKHYMEKAMEAVKARNIELEALAQKVQVGHSIIPFAIGHCKLLLAQLQILSCSLVFVELQHNTFHVSCLIDKLNVQSNKSKLANRLTRSQSHTQTHLWEGICSSLKTYGKIIHCRLLSQTYQTDVGTVAMTNMPLPLSIDRDLTMSENR